MLTEPPRTTDMRSRTLGAVGWMLSSRFVDIAANLVSIAILARLLTPSDFGAVGVLMALAMLAQILASWGMWNAIIQKPSIEERHVSTLMSAMGSVAILLAVALCLMGPAIEAFFAAPGLSGLTPIASAIIVVETLILFGDALLRRKHRFKELAIRDTATIVLVQLPVAITLAMAGYGASALLFGYLARGLVALAACYWMARFPLRPRFDRAAFYDLFGFGKWVGFGHVFIFLSQNGDNLVVGRALGVEALGLYGRAFQLINYPVNTLGASVKSIMFPMVSAIQSDLPRVRRAYLDGYRAIFLVGAGFTVVLISILPELVRVLLGAKWGAVVPIAQLLAVSLSIRIALKYLEAIPLALGKARSVMIRDFVNGASTVVAALIAVSYGVTAVAAAVSLVAFAVFLFAASLANKATGTSWRSFAAVHVPGLAAALAFLAAASVAEAWSAYAGLHHWPSLVAKLSTAAVTAFALYWFAGKRLLGPAHDVIDTLVRRLIGRSLALRSNSRTDTPRQNPEDDRS